MTNPLTFFSPTVRKVVYVTYAVLAVLFGATQVGYASADVAQPVFLDVAFDVLGYLGLVLGLTAAANTNQPTEPVSLARLCCDACGDDDARPLLDQILALLARAGELAADESGDVRFPPSAILLTAALSIARTPRAPGPA